MQKNPFFAGIALAVALVVSLLVAVRVRQAAGSTSDPTSIPDTDRPSLNGPTDGDTDPEAELRARRVAGALRGAVLERRPLDSILPEPEEDRKRAIRAYLDLLDVETDLHARLKMIHSLEGMPDPGHDVLAFLHDEVLHESRPFVLEILAEILGKKSDESSVPVFRALLDRHWKYGNPGEGGGVIGPALRGLGRIGSTGAREEILKRFWMSTVDDLRIEALQALGLAPDEEVFEEIERIALDEAQQEPVRLGAIRALSESLAQVYVPEDGAARLTAICEQVTDAHIRAQIVWSATAKGRGTGLRFAEGRLLDQQEAAEVRVAAVLALQAYGDAETYKVLTTVAERDEDQRLVSLAEQAAEKMRGRGEE